ncbi:MAG: hypothetical protein QGG36_32205, partial [Pirellulaceae bacterium]|nr:hypothetical protein [Pirellulaceae bacterium]
TRGGDQHVAAALLTSKAIEETRKRGLTVQPPGSPTMKYEIGRAEMSEDNEGVWVTSVWRETLEDGTVESYEIVWVLRKEQPGWRIAGMAAQLSPDESPMLINFEQPDELERRVTGTGNADSGAAAQQAQTPPAGAQR